MIDTLQARPLLLVILLCAALSACGGEEGNTGDPQPDMSADMMPDAEPAPALPEGCDLFVEPGEDDQRSVQIALIEVRENQTVCLGAGTFEFLSEVSLSVDGVTVRGEGMDATILDFTDQDSGGNGVKITSDGVTFEDLQVLNTPGDGIRADDVEDITFRRIKILWSSPEVEEHGAYGLYPVGCTRVVIENSVVDGASDAGIYVGQSNMIIVRDNEALNNVAGIEIENSNDAEVMNNHAHNNTGGIAIFDLPGLAQAGTRSKVHDNLVEDNNTENFGEPGSAVAGIPAGTGLFILASDFNEVHDNIIRNNESVGLAIVAYTSLFGDPSEKDPEFNPFPSGNFIHDNTFENNGTDPHDVAAAITSVRPIPDIVWDGCLDESVDNTDGRFDNCVSDNGEATYLNIDGICGDGSTDISEVTCEQEPLSTITF